VELRLFQLAMLGKAGKVVVLDQVAILAMQGNKAMYQPHFATHLMQGTLGLEVMADQQETAEPGDRGATGGQRFQWAAEVVAMVAMARAKEALMLLPTQTKVAPIDSHFP
jgi:hypothetical protein